MSAMPNWARRQSSERAAKVQRTMADSTMLETTAENMYIRITSLSVLQSHYIAYGAPNGAGGGAPLYSNMISDLHLGALNTPLEGTPTTGGNHPLGPEWAFNALRKDNLPLKAGLVDLNGQPIEVCPEQLSWDSYCGT